MFPVIGSYHSREEKMKGKRLLQAILMLSLLAAASALWGQSVLGTVMDSPEGVVKARKLMMQTLSANMKDVAEKITDGRVAPVSVNAASIGAVAVVLPPLYREKYESVYPVEGSASFFKGGSAADIEAAAGQLKKSADGLRAAAEKGDRAGTQAAFDALKPACGSCHSAFRGKF
jgi:cytochrome c556